MSEEGKVSVRLLEPTGRGTSDDCGEQFHPLLGGCVNDSLEYENVACFHVERLDGRARGYKGELPPGAQLRDIAEQWGDGHYRVIAHNAEGVPIAKKEHRIAMQLQTQTQSASHFEPILEAMRADKQVELARLEKLIDQAQGNAKHVSDVVMRTTDATLERERAAAERERQRQESFMSTLLAMMQQGFAQQMSLMRESAAQQASLERDRAQWNNPATVLSLFQQGLQVGREVGEGDSEPWEKAIQAGVKGLGEIKQLAQLGKPAVPNQTPAPAPAQKDGQKKATQKVLSREQLADVAKFKRICDATGQDFDELLKGAIAQYEAMMSKPLEEEPEASAQVQEGARGESSEPAASVV